MQQRGLVLMNCIRLWDWAGSKEKPVEISTGINEDGKVPVGQTAMNNRRRMPQNSRSEFNVAGRKEFIFQHFTFQSGVRGLWVDIKS